MKRFMLLVAVSAVAIGVVAALPASSGAVTCKLKAHNKVKCPTSKLKGPQGPQGPQGSTGPQGPAGSGGTSVAQFKFLSIGNTGNTTIATYNGAVAEASCSGSVLTNARLRATQDNNAAEALNLRLGTFSFDPDLDTGQSVNLLGAGSIDDQFGLTYLAANGAQVVTAHYSAYQGAPLTAGQYDCAIFGTTEVG
jgi:hypothetical protein